VSAISVVVIVVSAISVVVIVVSAISVVVIIVSTTTNYVDFHCWPSSFHICLPLSMVPFQALDTWYHFPS